MVDEVGLYSARCGERSQQLGIELDLLQDGRQDLLTILAYCRDGINQHSEDNLHTNKHLLHFKCNCNSRHTSSARHRLSFPTTYMAAGKWYSHDTAAGRTRPSS